MTLSPFWMPNFLSPFAALETFWWSCLYEIFCVSFGSSPIQTIAVLSFLSTKCRSIQFAEAFNEPSSNHFILTSVLLYLTSFIFLYGLIQLILLPSFFQNSLLFLIDSLYFFAYWDLLAKLLFTHSGLVFKINSCSFCSLLTFFLIFFFDFFFLADLFFLIFF